MALGIGMGVELCRLRGIVVHAHRVHRHAGKLFDAGLQRVGQPRAAAPRGGRCAIRTVRAGGANGPKPGAQLYRTWAAVNGGVLEAANWRDGVPVITERGRTGLFQFPGFAHG
ncbi:hypothetical protein D3C81_1040750 [compost metagenome]